MKREAIQDHYGSDNQHCWGCGEKNESGLKIRSYPESDGSLCVTRYTPGAEYTGGVPNNLFGGMIAMLFDCHGTASAAWFKLRERGGELDEAPIDRFITARLEIDFKKPVPMGEEVTVTARAEEIGARKVIVAMRMEAAGERRAEAKMVAVKLKK